MRAARVAQRDALQERHHHVGGGVVFPEAVDLDQRRMVEAGQQARLVDERAQADRVGLGERARAHRDLRPGAARGERRRHVFLERDLALERVVAGRGRRCRSRRRRARAGSRTRRSACPAAARRGRFRTAATEGLLRVGGWVLIESVGAATAPGDRELTAAPRPGPPSGGGRARSTASGVENSALPHRSHPQSMRNPWPPSSSTFPPARRSASPFPAASTPAPRCTGCAARARSPTPTPPTSASPTSPTTTTSRAGRCSTAPRRRA